MFLGVFWILSIGQSKYRAGGNGVQMGDMEMSPLGPVLLPADCVKPGGYRGASATPPLLKVKLGRGYSVMAGAVNSVTHDVDFRGLQGEYLTSPEGCHF